MSLLNLLQVEDSESDAELIVRRLSNAGYRVSSRRVDDAEAMRVALAEVAWDMVICDYQMPAFDAPAALEVLHESGQDLPFLVVSGTIGEDVAVALMRAGAHDYLMKDNLKRLGAAVDRELREANNRAERRQAMKDLAEREAQLSLAIESTELGIFDYDPVSGKVFYSDLARRHLLVSDVAEPSLQSFFASLHPDDRQRVERAVERAFEPQSGGRYAEHYRLKTPRDGEERWISAWGRVLRDAAGKPVRFVGVARDISERKRAERDLQFQLELTACITEQSADCILLTDLEDRVRFVNPEAERLFGYTSDEFRSRPLHDLLHHHYPDGRPFPANECQSTRDLAITGILREYEEVYFHKDGTPIDVAVSCVPLTLNSTRAGVVFTVRDIRERKRAELELRRSDARFRRMLDAGIIGIMILDGEYIVEANDHALKLIGVSREEVSTGKIPWTSVTAPDQIDSCQKSMQAIAETGSIPAFEKHYVRGDGTRVPVLFGGVALNPGQDSRILCFLVDLTERRNLETQMRQAQKLESIGLLAGGVAHDFNNLLTVILGYAHVVHEKLGPGHALLRSVDQIMAAATRAAGLTRQLLMFSRRNESAPRTIALDEVVRDTEGMLQRLIGESIDVIQSSDGNPQFIYADKGLIEQVILNLAVNARDAMPEGGKLYIETSRIAITEGFVIPSMPLDPGEYVSLSVTDTGTGMTPEVQAKVFEPFFTTKEPGKGTGLGLSTVYGIVKQSGGAITVHSAPGVGTSMRVLFPPATDSVAQVTAPEEAPVTGTETILLVEDESGIRSYVRQVLEDHGYRVLDAAHAEDAIALAERYPARFELALIDVVLPGMKSADLISRLREMRPGMALMRMSGYPEQVVDGVDRDIPFLQKPFTADKLLRRIREVLDRQTRSREQGAE